LAMHLARLPVGDVLPIFVSRLAGFESFGFVEQFGQALRGQLPYVNLLADFGNRHRTDGEALPLLPVTPPAGSPVPCLPGCSDVAGEQGLLSRRQGTVVYAESRDPCDGAWTLAHVSLVSVWASVVF